MNTALVELHYMPCIAWFSAISDCHQVVVEKFEHYQKQSYRNRCYIRGPHQIETLIVPVNVPGGKARITEVRIDYSQKWLGNHWRTLQTAYGKAPFFEYYGPELHQILYRKHVFLYDLNFDIMTMCLKWLKIKAAVTESESFAPPSASVARDVRGLLNPKKEDGCNRFYKSIEYHQVFGSKFVPNLSLIDLIFNQGPGARDILNASANDEQ